MLGQVRLLTQFYLQKKGMYINYTSVKSCVAWENKKKIYT